MLHTENIIISMCNQYNHENDPILLSKNSILLMSMFELRFRLAPIQIPKSLLRSLATWGIQEV